MKYEEFIRQVQDMAQLASGEEAIHATTATLEIIKERIVGDEAKDLAAQLPEDLAKYLRGREGENGQHFDLQEFIQRVSEKEGIEPTVAVMHIRAVFTVLKSAVTEGEFEDFKANFSSDYAELLPAKSISEFHV